MIRNIPGFKNIGHYDLFMIDETQLLTEKIYGYPIMDWWKNTMSTRLPIKESMGIVPVNAHSEWETVTQEDVKTLSADFQFLAKRQHSKVCYIFNTSGPVPSSRIEC